MCSCLHLNVRLSLCLSWCLLPYFTLHASYISLSLPLSSISDPLFLSLRNWPVKYSWCDQQHFTKSTVTQPTWLLAHQKAVMAALTRHGVRQRRVSECFGKKKTTQTALRMTATIHMSERAAACATKDRHTQVVASHVSMCNLCCSVICKVIHALFGIWPFIVPQDTMLAGW